MRGRRTALMRMSDCLGSSLKILCLAAVPLVIGLASPVAADPAYVYRIQNQAEPGSGFILKLGSRFFLVTAKHVLGTTSEDIKISNSSGKSYHISANEQLLLSNLDLAVVPIQLPELMLDAVTALPDAVPQNASLTVWGYPVNPDALQSKLSSRQGQYLGSPSKPTDGYELLYTAKTQVGFSGGPILTENGNVVGIHGRSEGSISSTGVVQRTGNALGIPISKLLAALASGSANSNAPGLSALRRENAIVALGRVHEILSDSSMSDQVITELDKAATSDIPDFCIDLSKAYYYSYYSSVPDLAKARESIKITSKGKAAPSIYYVFASTIYKKSGDYPKALAIERMAEKAGGGDQLQYSERHLQSQVLQSIKDCARTP